MSKKPVPPWIARFIGWVISLTILFAVLAYIYD